jgi:excinuclease ABC subunit B
VPIREEETGYVKSDEIAAAVEELTKEMKEAARNLEFERAAQLRDEIKELSRLETELGLWG